MPLLAPCIAFNLSYFKEGTNSSISLLVERFVLVEPRYDFLMLKTLFRAADINVFVLLVSLERKPEHGEPHTILSDGTPKPILKATPAEYIAHEGKVLPPSSNLNSVPHQDELSAPPNSQFSSEVHLNGNFTIGQQQPQRNSIGPAFLFIPKRRVLHNVRSVIRDFVPVGRFSFIFSCRS